MYRMMLIGIAVVGLTMTMQSSADAASPDYSLCDGLAGAPFGLCRAGVSIGCREDDLQEGCLQIEEQFERISGSPQPWVPGECPCYTAEDLVSAFSTADLCVMRPAGAGDGAVTDGLSMSRTVPSVADDFVQSVRYSDSGPLPEGTTSCNYRSTDPFEPVDNRFFDFMTEDEFAGCLNLILVHAESIGLACN